jgi:pyridoxine 5-phosphate synthase
VVELHTGAWCNALALGEAESARREFMRLAGAATHAEECGIECHAGHGLDFDTAREIARLPQVIELNIGHFLIGEAVFTGLRAAIAKMRSAMDAGRRLAASPAAQA